ncbi:MAG: cation:dicarboxylase symporter family transporter [Bacteroidota bacterium]|nr:cation:dicarboxylase symporter family transporter [Bacteroidota bacterium]
MKFPSLTTQIFVSMTLAVAFGAFFPETAKNFQILSDIFLRLIKMIIAPLVISTLIVGIAKLGDVGSVGRIGGKTLIYFYSATIVSLLLGLLLVNIFQPGHMMQLTLPPQGADTGLSTTSGGDLKSFFYRLVPISIVDAMAKNEILPIVIFAIFFGLGLGAVGEKGKPVFHFMDSVAEIMFKVTAYVMVFAPLGVFGALSSVVAKQGIGVLAGYAYLIACFYGGLIIFAAVILGAVCYFSRLHIPTILRTVREPLLLAFGTASSEAAFPKTMEALEKLGCPPKIVGFVLPLGYSFNLDAAMMNMTFATMFIAQAYGMELTVSQQLTMLFILLMASKGVAGVPRASLVVVASMLGTFGIPIEGLLLLLGIDHILDMGRSVVNLYGNVIATCVISIWEDPQFELNK